MSINKYSSPEEVLAYYEGWDINQSLEAHINRFYPTEPIGSGLTQPTLKKIIRTLSTKAMETL